MIEKLTKTLALSLLVITMAACGGSDDDEGPDTQGPSVEITTPNTTDTYKRSGNLPLEATFTDNRGLDNCEITIDYVGEIPGSAELKGIGTPWTPAESNKVHTIKFNDVKTKDVNESQLFDMSIEPSCLSGVYRLTFVISDNAPEPNVTTETIDIKIGG